MLAKRKRSRKSGFTLMEVLLVMAILVVLAGIAALGYTQMQKGAYRDKAQVDIQAIETACQAYQLHMGTLPTSIQDLAAAPNGSKKWRGPYLDVSKPIPTDPWDQQYVIQPRNINGMDVPWVYSIGPDGQDGSGDEISNLPLN